MEVSPDGLPDIWAEFSIGMDPSSFKPDGITIYGPFQTRVAGTISCEDRKMHFVPDEPLARSTLHTIHLSDAVRAQNGQALDPFRWSFTNSACGLLCSVLRGHAGRPGSGLLFVGYGYDAEDKSLSGDHLSWSSSRDGFLGAGNSLPMPSLSPGGHTITLTATDSTGHTGTASIRIRVRHKPCLPIVAAHAIRSRYRLYLPDVMRH
jgi:hypothetical protein